MKTFNKFYEVDSDWTAQVLERNVLCADDDSNIRL